MKDLKYLAAYTIPLATAISLAQEGWGLYCTVFYVFVIVPIADWGFGKGEKNLNQKEVQKKEPMMVFDFMLYFNVPLVFALLGWSLWNFSNIEYENFERIGLVLSMGIFLATNAINVAHELGHRASLFERTLSKLLYMPCLYMHFYIEHNFGHHLNVATSKDGASAKYNQNLYFFWIRSVTKQYVDAWKKQNELLKKSNTRFFSLKNDMFWYIIIQFIYLFTIFYAFSYKTMMFAIATGVISFLFLETINYIEHYGLRRKKLKSGRYERVKEIHSWNSDHNVGRIVLYELTRHSDHHFKSGKKYQILNRFKESPQLPYGYPASILISFFPPLWFMIMNRRVPKEMILEKG
tara:strand:+ start:1290 stop:2339 length:1050 start_codon:yes stop_codon:yes gene_type:complete